MNDLYTIKLSNGVVVNRHAWTGGDTPPKKFKNKFFKEIKRIYFRELLEICGGLDLWKCAGTGSIERAGIFWKQANLDAWRTWKSSNLI